MCGTQRCPNVDRRYSWCSWIVYVPRVRNWFVTGHCNLLVLLFSVLCPNSWKHAYSARVTHSLLALEATQLSYKWSTLMKSKSWSTGRFNVHKNVFQFAMRIWTRFAATFTAVFGGQRIWSHFFTRSKMMQCFEMRAICVWKETHNGNVQQKEMERICLLDLFSILSGVYSVFIVFRFWENFARRNLEALIFGKENIGSESII